MIVKSNIDIDAFRLFVLLFEAGSLSEAAAKSAMSVSAASRLLAKLRRTFNDELFTRYAHGMTPTSRARELYPSIVQMLQGYTKLFDEETFNPKKLTRVFRVGAVDQAVYTFFGPALVDLLRDGQKLAIEFRAPSEDFLRELSRGDLDMAIYPNLTQKQGFHTAVLGDNTFVLAVRKDHPLVKLQSCRPLTSHDLKRWRQIRVSLSMAPGFEERWGIPTTNIPIVNDGDVAVWTPYFLSVPALLCESDLVAVLPLHLANQIAKSGDLFVLGRPEGAPIFRPTLIWHESTHQDPASQWLRATVISACSHVLDLESYPTIPY